MNIGSGARELGISSRQMKRVWRRFKGRGAHGLLSLKKGKPSPNKIPDILKKKVLRLVKKKYWDYGPTLACEKLEEKHSLKLCFFNILSFCSSENLFLKFLFCIIHFMHNFSLGFLGKFFLGFSAERSFLFGFRESFLFPFFILNFSFGFLGEGKNIFFFQSRVHRNSVHIE